MRSLHAVGALLVCCSCSTLLFTGESLLRREAYHSRLLILSLDAPVSHSILSSQGVERPLPLALPPCWLRRPPRGQRWCNGERTAI